MNKNLVTKSVLFSVGLILSTFGPAIAEEVSKSCTCCESCICLDKDSLKIDTQDCLKSLSLWKTNQDKFFIRGYAIVQLFSSEFKPEKDLDMLKNIYGEQINFFDNAFKLLNTKQEDRQTEWYQSYLSEIGAIENIIRNQTTEPLVSTLEAKAMISQQINHLETMLKNKDIGSLEFCKQCWLILESTELKEIRTFIERHEYSMTEEEVTEFEQFKEEHPVKIEENAEKDSDVLANDENAETDILENVE